MRAFLSTVAGATFVALATMTTAGHAEQIGLYFGADVGLLDFDLPAGKASEFGDGEIASPSVDGTNFRLRRRDRLSER